MLVLVGCAKPPTTQATLAGDPLVTHAYAATPAPVLNQALPPRIFNATSISGRTFEVEHARDIVLQPGEVILTFDDGPRPGKTDLILATLGQFDVGATFLMLGSAAEAHPALVRRVAAAGHSIGSHTFSHINLTSLGRQEALDEIAKGERAVEAALQGSGVSLSPFFRFPYLSQSGFLRTGLFDSGLVVLDVDIDSKDYFHETPEQVTQRTLDRLDAKGSGIILFHDIHQRTVDLLPGFLATLQQRGYAVVRLVPKPGTVVDKDLLVAHAQVTDAAL